MPQSQDGYDEVHEAPVNNPPPRLTQPTDALIGTTLAAKYKILKKLGEGGMGSVYQAQQMPIDRMVAIKVLLGRLAQDEVALKRFEQEAKAISRMQHPNTVTIYDYGKTDDDRLYIVMEYLKGKTLSDALRATGGSGLDAKRAVHIVRQVCASLADAHGAGIIHRDLKPDNIFLTEVGTSKDWVKVLDFGVAKLADHEAGATLTQTGMIFGTPKYMSPEQAEGKPIDNRADVYAIGVVMFEMLTGRPPFVAETPVSLLLKHISEPAPSFGKVRPDLAVPPELEAVVMKTLEKSPDRRYPKVEDLSADLEACLRLLVTGPVSVAPDARTGSLGAPRPLPTEVNAPASTSPASLVSPAQVPSGISLGPPDIRRMPTEPAPPNEANTARAPGLVHRPDPATFATMGTAPGSPTRPIPGTGPGIDTLGGIPNELSHPIHGSARPASRVPLIAGAIAAVLAVAVVAAAKLGVQEESSIASQPLQVAPADDPKPPSEPVAEEAPPPPAPVVQPRQDPPAPTKHVAREREPKAPAPAKKISVRFTSTPPGAVVAEVGGAQLGVTPFTRDYVRGADMVRVKFTLDGYESHAEMFTLASDRNVSADLKKRSKADPKPVVEAKPPETKTIPRTEGTSLDERVGDLRE